MADWSFDGVGWWSVNLKLRIKMDIKCEIISVIARTLNVEESVITMEMAAGDIEQWTRWVTWLFLRLLKMN